MGEIASQITSLTIVCSTAYSDADQRKHQSSASLAFVRRIHRGQKASNAENVSIWWRHHALFIFFKDYVWNTLTYWYTQSVKNCVQMCYMFKTKCCSKRGVYVKDCRGLVFCSVRSQYYSYPSRSFHWHRDYHKTSEATLKDMSK